MEKRSWGWLPAQMPGVARLLDEKKREVGTLWADAELIAFASAGITSTQALVILRPLEGVAHGAR